MPELIINDIKIDVVRKNIKNIHLAVYPPKGRVRISVPLTANDDTIRMYSISKISWIRRQQRKFESQERQPLREYKDREGHYFQGKRYLMKVVETKAPPKISLPNSSTLELSVRPGTSIEKKKAVLNNWYRQQLKEIIPGIIEKWEKILKVEVKNFGIRQMKTKWGTCNIKAKRIWLNLELAKKPLHCLEYIVVHEMIHLLERNHNERFKSYLDEFLPQWKKYMSELNKFPVSHSEWKY